MNDHNDDIYFNEIEYGFDDDYDMMPDDDEFSYDFEDYWFYGV